MKRAAFATVIALVMVVLLLEAYPWLSWKYWHWKNNHVLSLRGYRVDIPERFIVNVLGQVSTLVVDARPRLVNARLLHPQIAFLRSRPDPQLRANIALETRVDQSGKQLLPIDTIAGEKARCFTDDSLSATLQNKDALTGNCVTEGGLLILLSGMKEDLPDLLQVVSTTTKSN